MTNYKPFWNYMPFSVLSALGIRDISSDLLGMFLLLVQSFSVGCHVIRSSPESYNVKLAMELFDWTQEAVKVTSE